jgi:hypothetical protein
MHDSETRAAMAQGMADAEHRRDWYAAHPAGVPAGTTGADPQPLMPPPDHPAVTGVHGQAGGGH